jgi:hypothetical protein
MENKEIIAFTVYDEKNARYAEKLQKSFHYFHPDIPLRMFNDTEVRKAKDPDIFYKQKPYFADKLFREGYKNVLGLDADQIILGSLDYIFKSKGYDVGTVLNFNLLDARNLGPITIQGVHHATEYHNAGLVMMRSHKFVKHWLRLCQSKYFKRFQYREQDLLNILTHFCDYQVKCYDDADDYEKYFAWHGLLASRSTLNMQMVNGDVYLPAAPDGFPSRDVIVKVWHPAGGQSNTDKLNYRIAFNEDVIEHINKILK